MPPATAKAIKTYHHKKNNGAGSSIKWTKKMEPNTKTYKHIKTQADAVLYFLQHLDIEMIDTLLEPNRTYQNFEKEVFVQKLGRALAEFKQSGDTFLNKYTGHCNFEECNYLCKGFSFVGNNSKNYFDLIIDIKDGVVQDIFECSKFKCRRPKVRVKKCIVIDKIFHF